jgi:hypothetical protein
MACVFLLGPDTNFGQSEQNPEFWLKLFLSAKIKGCKLIWTDEVGRKFSKQVSLRDWQIWMHFFMSYLVNGIGFHILLHALPIQAGMQESLSEIVLQAISMLYLVKLDDISPDYKLTIVETVENVEGVPAGDTDETNEITKSTQPADINDDTAAGITAEIIAKAQKKLAKAQEKIMSEAQEDLEKRLGDLAASKGAVLWEHPMPGEVMEEGELIFG